MVPCTVNLILLSVHGFLPFSLWKNTSNRDRSSFLVASLSLSLRRCSVQQCFSLQRWTRKWSKMAKEGPGRKLVQIRELFWGWVYCWARWARKQSPIWPIYESSLLRTTFPPLSTNSEVPPRHSIRIFQLCFPFCNTSMKINHGWMNKFQLSNWRINKDFMDKSYPKDRKSVV